MRSRNFIILNLSLLLFSIFISCYNNSTDSLHEHTYSEIWSFDENNHWHDATCKHTELTSEFGPHEFNQGEITKDATENENGIKTYICTVCKYEKIEIISKLSEQNNSTDSNDLNNNSSDSANNNTPDSTPKSPTYQVFHYCQNADNDEYSIVTNDTQIIESKSGELTTATAKDYSGFTVKPIQQKEVLEDNSTIVNIYYDRIFYTINFDSNGGSYIAPISAKYGAKITEPSNPKLINYVFSGWDSEFPETMPLGGMNLKAKWYRDALNISIYLPNNNPVELLLTTKENDKEIIFTANQIDNAVYEWFFCSDKIPGETLNTIKINKADFTSGTFIIMVVADVGYDVYTAKAFVNFDY